MTPPPSLFLSLQDGLANPLTTSKRGILLCFSDNQDISVIFNYILKLLKFIIYCINTQISKNKSFGILGFLEF